MVKLGMAYMASYRDRETERWESVVGPDFAARITSSRIQGIKFGVLTGLVETTAILATIWIAATTYDLGLLVLLIPGIVIASASVVIARSGSPRNIRARIAADLWASGVDVLGKPSLRSVYLFSLWATANRVVREDLVKAAASAAPGIRQSARVPVGSASGLSRIAVVLMSICFAATSLLGLPALTIVLTGNVTLTLPITLLSFLFWSVLAALILAVCRDPRWPASTRPALTVALPALLVIDGTLVIIGAPIGSVAPWVVGVFDVVALVLLWVPSTSLRVGVERAAQIARRSQVTARFDATIND
jgi:hypothetical protein